MGTAEGTGGRAPRVGGTRVAQWRGSDGGHSGGDKWGRASEDPCLRWRGILRCSGGICGSEVAQGRQRAWGREGCGAGRAGGAGGAGGAACTHIPSPGPYRTRPLVFLSTEAAKLCVTPTRLVPSTSTMRSFTWILRTRGPSQHGHPLPTPTHLPAAQPAPPSPPKPPSRSRGGVRGWAPHTCRPGGPPLPPSPS